MLENVGSGGVGKKKVRRFAAERVVIVAESYEPGATVAGVARRHGVVASQLSSWRSAARAKASDGNGGVQFAEVAVSPDGFGAPPVPHDGVEIAVVGSVVIPRQHPASLILRSAWRRSSDHPIAGGADCDRDQTYRFPQRA